MAYRYGNRTQISLLPDTIEKYITDSDPVRAYDSFIDCFDISELGIDINPKAVGNSSYDPITMLKILVYAYSYGWRSSRKIERALHHNLSFIWLSGGLKPGFKTISNFRKDNKEALKNVLTQCARICLNLNLIEGNTLFTDGSKFRANAGNRETKTLEKWEHYKIHIEKRIDELLEESKSIDENEVESLININKELISKENLKKKINTLLVDFKDEERVNGTDPECRILKGRQGSHAGYNVQSTTDEAHGLIVTLDGTQAANDLSQLSTQVHLAEETLEKKCAVVCADAGYSSIDDLEKLVSENKTVIVPSVKQAGNDKKDSPFSKEHFKYDPKQDIYICPNGKELYLSTKKKGLKVLDYRMKNIGDCSACEHWGKCTNAKQGRSIRRSIHEHIKEDLAKLYECEEGQEIYSKRKMVAELQFGHLKHNLGAGAFLLRGINGVNAELGILGTCFNIARMITLLGGVRPMMSKLARI